MRIPTPPGHRFRTESATDSGRSRPLIPERSAGCPVARAIIQECSSASRVRSLREPQERPGPGLRVPGTRGAATGEGCLRRGLLLGVAGSGTGGRPAPEQVADSTGIRISRGRRVVVASAPSSAAPYASGSYARREPENTVLPRVVREHLERSSGPCMKSAANRSLATSKRSFAGICVAGSWRTAFCASCARSAVRKSLSRSRANAAERARRARLGGCATPRRTWWITSCPMSRCGNGC